MYLEVPGLHQVPQGWSEHLARVSLYCVSLDGLRGHEVPGERGRGGEEVREPALPGSHTLTYSSLCPTSESMFNFCTSSEFLSTLLPLVSVQSTTCTCRPSPPRRSSASPSSRRRGITRSGRRWPRYAGGQIYSSCCPSSPPPGQVPECGVWPAGSLPGLPHSWGGEAGQAGRGGGQVGSLYSCVY